MNLICIFFNCLLVISLLQIGKQETEEILLEAKADAQNGIHQSLERHSSRKISSSDQLEHRSLHASTLKKNDQIVNLSVGSDDSDRKHSMGDHSLRTSSLEGHEALNEPPILELSAQNSGGKFVEESNINNSTSILDKIFGSAIANLTDSVAPVMVCTLCEPLLFEFQLLFLMRSYEAPTYLSFCSSPQISSRF